LDPEGTIGDVQGKAVLCLASGGGQQSVAFALLGAKVTVVDLSDDQLTQDKKAACHYGVNVRTLQGDMRDLSLLAGHHFDVVWHPYSLNFVPDCRVVFRQVARVIKADGLYQLMAANPFVCGLGTRDWNGRAYELRMPYVEGAEVTYGDEEWVYSRADKEPPIPGPKEYRQTLGRLINGLVQAGFVLVKCLEWDSDPPARESEPGTWDHFRLHAPPWFHFWARYRPDLGVGDWLK
jgi:SAM-dependent methyltransferase